VVDIPLINTKIRLCFIGAWHGAKALLPHVGAISPLVGILARRREIGIEFMGIAECPGPGAFVLVLYG